MMMNRILIAATATALFGICLCGKVGAEEIDYNVGVHYYPWYYNDFHGRQYLREHLVPAQLPELGEYNDRDEAVINQHLKWSRDAGIDFWSASWWGPGSREDVTLLNHILQNPNLGNLKIAILYETVGRTDDFQDYSNLGPDITYLANNYFAHPNYLKINGKPVIIVYLTRVLSSLGTLESSLLAMREAALDAGYELYIMGDHVFGSSPASPGDIALLDAITNYDVYGSMGATGYAGQTKVDGYYTAQAGWKALAENVGTDYAPAVCPGFNDRGVRAGHDPLSRKLTQDSEFGSLFRAMLRGAKALIDPDLDHMILVTSWNEWHEDTQIEPVEQAPPTSLDDSPTGNDYTSGLAYEGYGTRYLDILREETFSNEYVMVVRQRTDGKYKLQIYDVPTSVGGNTGPPIASDNNIGLIVLDIGGGECDGNAGDELVVMRGTPGKARKLFVYSMPDEVGGNTGPAIASDRWFGKYRDYMTVGNFDDDPEPEVTVVQYVSAKDIYRLFIYDMPTTVDGDTGPAIASDRNIGGNVIGIAAANFDADPEDELVIVRLRADSKHKLQIYDVPTTVGGNTGTPIVSDNNIGRYIITCGVAAGDFDDDPEPEVAVVRLLASGNHKLVIYDAPTSVGGDTGPPIATDNNIGKNIAAIATFTAGGGPVTYKTYGLNFSPYIDGQDPNEGSEVSEQQLRERMQIIAPFTEWIRSFGSTHGLENTGRIAREFNLKTAIGAWLDSDLTTNETEIRNLIDAAKDGYVDLAIVGSEVLRRGDLTEDRLIQYIEQFRNEVPLVPVTTGEIYGELLSHPEIMDACDVIFANYHPYWEGNAVGQAVAYLHARHQEVVARASGKEVIVSETGWPSCGDQIGEAVPTLGTACFYFLNFVSWARAEGVKYFYFEAFDEEWKAKYEGPQGACWGIWDKEGKMKPCMQYVFGGQTIPDNWTCQEIPGGPGDPAIEFTNVPPYGSFEDLEGQVWHVQPEDYRVAVYIYVNGGWWTNPYWNNPLTIIECDGNWICDITTGGVDETATIIVAYLVPVGYDPPLAAGEVALPAELEQNAAAWVQEIRTPQ